jgi:hypothetical protein
MRAHSVTSNNGHLSAVLLLPRRAAIPEITYAKGPGSVDDPFVVLGSHNRIRRRRVGIRQRATAQSSPGERSFDGAIDPEESHQSSSLVVVEHWPFVCVSSSWQHKEKAIYSLFDATA